MSASGGGLHHPGGLNLERDGVCIQVWEGVCIQGCLHLGGLHHGGRGSVSGGGDLNPRGGGLHPGDRDLPNSLGTDI